MLVDQRGGWKEAFNEGDFSDLPVTLETYRKERDSELWRMAKVAEILCEYIIWLEEKLDEQDV